MRIGNNFWIDSYKDFKELEEVYDGGMRLASPLKFSHSVNDNGTVYYCFCPTDRRVDGSLYVSQYRITDVFDMLGATVSVDINKDNIIKTDNTITFTPYGMVINHGKTIKYKHENDMVYRLQKTQYKGDSPYGFLTNLIDPFWDNVTHNALVTIGYIKQFMEWIMFIHSIFL